MKKTIFLLGLTSILLSNESVQASETAGCPDASRVANAIKGRLTAVGSEIAHYFSTKGNYPKVQGGTFASFDLELKQTEPTECHYYIKGGAGQELLLFSIYLK
jgi:hypothetical protein